MKWIEKQFLKLALNKALKKFKHMKGSWKTTALGILGGLALIIPAVYALLTGDASIAETWDILVAGIAMIGIGKKARDNDVSSEDAGAK